MLNTDAALIQEEAHGGGLDAARAAWPDAPDPWLDLSTGINPWCYPLPPIPAQAWTRLPETADLWALHQAAADCYGAPGAEHVVAAPGTQAVIQWLPRLVPRTRVAILGPTYAEHAACWRLAGHDTTQVPDLETALESGAGIVVVVNPNNPDGRVLERDTLLQAAAILERRGGWLVVDEAFMDVDPAHSLAADAGRPALLVLRSFGKFYGLAGLRLGFILAAPASAAILRRAIGPWAVPGPAMAVAAEALADRNWAERMRQRLVASARDLDECLSRGGLALCGGTALFRLVSHPDATQVAEALAGLGILVRRFADRPTLLRIGLPADAVALDRLRAALRIISSAADGQGLR